MEYLEVSVCLIRNLWWPMHLKKDLQTKKIYSTASSTICPIRGTAKSCLIFLGSLKESKLLVAPNAKVTLLILKAVLTASMGELPADSGGKRKRLKIKGLS